MRNQIKKLLCAGFVSGIALCTNAQSYSNAVMALHPVAYYPLNEAVAPPLAPTFAITNYGTDSAANMTPNFDIVYGFPTPLASQPNDSSDYFNGNSSYAQAAYDTNVSTVPSFTIEGWFLSRNPGGGTQCAVSDFDGGEVNGNRTGWLVYIDLANAGQYTFRTYNANGTSPSLSLNLGGAGSILADKWYHLAVVVNASGGVTNVSGYINGALVSGPTQLNSYIPNDGLTGGFSAGIRSDIGFAFAGGIDELAYYTNALAGADILAHYQAATNPAPLTAYDQLVLQQHPVLYYRFNESAPSLVNPYPVPLPVANNAGSFGASANGFYTVDSIPGGVPGPTNSGFGGLTALELNPTGIASTTTAGPGVWCEPWNSELFNLTNAISVTFWTEMAVTPGYFSSVMGRSDQSWRFDVDPSGLPHWAAAPNGDLVGPTSLADSTWHYWAGVFDPVANVGTLYIDGVAVASAPWSALASEVRYPLLIGGVADYVNGARNFPGNIAQVAVFTNALTATQVNSLYSAAGGSVPHASVLLTAVTVNEGSSTNLTASGSGSLPLGFQWYVIDTTPATNPIVGATSLTLPLNAVTAAQNGYQYFMVASNAYGTATSGTITLTVVAGPPVLVTDISPLSSQLPVGVNDQFSISAVGTQPFTYTWFANSSPVNGATSSVYSFAVLAGANTYDCVISNAHGAITSSVATVTGLTAAPPIITFGDGSLWTTNNNSGTPSTSFGTFLAPGTLQLTDGNGGEASSAFYIFPQYIDGFVASFTYSAPSSNNGADGTTFLVQNDPTSTNALGGGGGELGYYGIGNSAAFELNLYTGANGGSGISYGTDGATPDSPILIPPYISSSPVAINGGNPINVQIAFFNGVMRVKLVDTVTLATYVGSHTFGDLLSIVGSASGYIGFTGATGGVSSIQDVSNFQFSYTTPPVLSLKATNGNAVVSWPISVATLFQLQSAPSIAGPFTTVTNVPVVVGNQNQVTLPITAGHQQYFQLVLP